MNRRLILLLIAVLLVGVVAQDAAAVSLGDFVRDKWQFLSKNGTHIVANAIILFLAMFILQTFLLHELNEKQKRIVYGIIILIAVFVAFTFLADQYLWEYGILRAILHFKVIVNFAVVYAVLHFLNALILRDKLGQSKELQTGTVLVIILIAAFIVYSPIHKNNDTYPDDYAWVWEKGWIKGLIGYLFGGDGTHVGILTGENLAVFIGASILMFWLFSSMVKVSENPKITAAIAIIIAAAIANKGISWGSFASMAIVIAIILLLHQFHQNKLFDFEVRNPNIATGLAKFILRFVTAYTLVTIIAAVLFGTAWFGPASLWFAGEEPTTTTTTMTLPDGTSAPAAPETAAPGEVNKAGFGWFFKIIWWPIKHIFTWLIWPYSWLGTWGKVIYTIIITWALWTWAIGARFGKSTLFQSLWGVGIRNRVERRVRKLRRLRIGTWRIFRFLWPGKEHRFDIQTPEGVRKSVTQEVRRLNVEIMAYINYLLRMEVINTKRLGVVDAQKKITKYRSEAGTPRGEVEGKPPLEREDTKERILAQISCLFSADSFKTTVDLTKKDKDESEVRNISDRNEVFACKEYAKKEIELQPKVWTYRFGVANSANPVRELFKWLKTEEIESTKVRTSSEVTEADRMEAVNRVNTWFTPIDDNRARFRKAVRRYGTYHIMDDDELERFDNFIMDGEWTHSLKFAKPLAIVEYYVATLEDEKDAPYPVRRFKLNEHGKLDVRLVGPTFMEMMKTVEDAVLDGKRLNLTNMSDEDIRKERAKITREEIEQELEKNVEKKYDGWTIGMIESAEGRYPYEVDHHGWVLRDQDAVRNMRNLLDNISNVNNITLPDDLGTVNMNSAQEVIIRRVRGTDWLRPSRHLQIYLVGEARSYQWDLNEWDNYMQDLRTGRFHPNTATYNDYRDLLDEGLFYERNVKRAPGQDIANPAFDKEALKDVKNIHYTSKKDFWKEDGNEQIFEHTNDNPENPWPMISINGTRAYLRHYLRRVSDQEGKDLKDMAQMFIAEEDVSDEKK